MFGSKAIGMFVKVGGVEALQKDMEEEFIINSVLSWKPCKRTYNKQEDFFIINLAFPSVRLVLRHCAAAACSWVPTPL